MQLLEISNIFTDQYSGSSELLQTTFTLFVLLLIHQSIEQPLV